MLTVARYLTNKPEGWPETYLIVAVVLALLAAGWGGWQKDPYRVLMGVAVAAIPLALLRPI